MIVRCSQCGAKINRKDENRFFKCPFCTSSLVLEGGCSFACLVMEHERNDLWARAVFLERLKKSGFGKNVGAVSVSFSYVPFWVLRRRDGTATARPAAETGDIGLSSIKVPPGRFVFFEGDSRPGASVVAPTVSLGAARGDEKEESLARVDLAYLPVYSMRSTGPAGEHRSLLVADSSRLYSTTVSTHTRAPYLRPLLFFTVAACLFAAAGLWVDNVYYRSAAIVAGGIILILISPLAIGRIR